MANFNYNENQYPVDKRYDFTVIGAGTAGIFLALKLALKGRKVLIIESGQQGINPQSQELNTAITAGRKLTISHNKGRKRALGGTSLAWGGQALPFCDIDFVKKDWVEYSGWPILLEELDYHYGRAIEFLGIDDLDFRKEIFSKIKVEDPGFDPSLLDFHVAKWAKNKDFYKVFEKSNAAGIDIIYNAVLKTVQQENGKVTSIEIVNTKGNNLKFPVTNLVLSNGTIETIRTMLYNKLSNSDWLGKAFMDHPCIEVGVIAQQETFDIQKRFAPHRWKGLYYSMRMTLSQEQQVKDKLLNCSAGVMFTPRPGQSNPYADFKQFMKTFHPKHLWGMMKSGPRLFKSLFIFFTQGFHFKGMFEGKIVIMAEQAPCKESTVSLSEELDIVGVPKPVINWVLTRKTWDSVVTTSRNVRDEFKRLGLGKIVLYPHVRVEEPEWEAYLSDVNHHMGGARMSDHPGDGVVDKNLKVWGMDNLFLCSPAVFPTGSHSNPVLTLLALSNRLADHMALFAAKAESDGKSLSDSVSSASISY